MRISGLREFLSLLILAPLILIRFQSLNASALYNSDETKYQWKLLKKIRKSLSNKCLSKIHSPQLKVYANLLLQNEFSKKINITKVLIFISVLRAIFFAIDIYITKYHLLVMQNLRLRENSLLFKSFKWSS